jgi:hypothetical protein
MLEFDADLLQVAVVWRPMNRTHLSPNRRRLGRYVQAHDLQRDPGSEDIVVAGRIAAAVQIHAGRNGSLDERLAQATLAEDDQRDGSVDASAAARFLLNKIIRGARKRGLAHVFSLEMHSEFPMVFGAAHVSPGKFRRSRDPTPVMLAEPCFIVEFIPAFAGSCRSAPRTVARFAEATKARVSDRLAVR